MSIGKQITRYRKVLAEKVARGSSSALAALFGAWVQSLSGRQRLSWQDVGIGAGLAALWLLQRQSQRR